jgi:hypothetical protein
LAKLATLKFFLEGSTVPAALVISVIVSPNLTQPVPPPLPFGQLG